MFLKTFVTLIYLTLVYNQMCLQATDEDVDPEWEELFGHLSKKPVTVSRPNKYFFGKNKNGDARPVSRPTVPPAEAAPPLQIQDSEEGRVPSIGATSHAGMEGIAISQNRGVSLGLYIVNSTHNSFNTIFGDSNVTHSKSRPKKPPSSHTPS